MALYESKSTKQWIFISLMLSIGSVFFIACTRPIIHTDVAKPLPLGNNSHAFRAVDSSGLQSNSRVQASNEPEGLLTLQQALSLALMKNPELKAYSWEIRAKEASLLQSSLLPNPEVAIQVENAAGQNENSSFDSAETTIELSQLILLGRKREKRTRLAAIKSNLADRDYEIKRLDILTSTTIAFVNLVAAQAQLNQAEELLHTSEEIYLTVAERINAGKVSPVEETRASVILTNSQIQLKKATLKLETARKLLASMWGSKSPRFEKAAGKLDDVSTLPVFESLENLIARNPEIVRWAVEIQKSRAKLDLERARRIKDLKLSAGARRFEDTDDYAFVFGVSIPLPLFDRNQGGILEAQSRLAKAKEEQRAVTLRIRRALAQAYENTSSAYTETMALTISILPAAEKAFKAVSEGYREGKFRYLDVLDAQRTLFEAKTTHIQTLAAYHKAKAHIERLLGQRLDAVGEVSSQKLKGDS
jgi:cobalt-zinc-cadmium efflux system outer membrane protein